MTGTIEVALRQCACAARATEIHKASLRSWNRRTPARLGTAERRTLPLLRLSRACRARPGTPCYAVQARTRELTYIEKHAEFTPEPARGAHAVWGNGWL